MSALTRPLVVVVLALLAGLLAGLRSGAPPVPWLAAAAASATWALSVSRRSGLAGSWHPGDLAAAGAFLCAGVAAGGEARTAAAADCRAAFPDRAPVAMSGVLAANAAPLADTARAFPPAFPLLVSRVRVDGREVPGCRGEMRVRLPLSAAGLLAGSEVQVRGTWARFREVGPPSAWPRNPRFRGTLRADTFALLSPPRFREHPFLTLRGRTERHLYRLFPRHGALADALVLGRREGLDPELQQSFAQSGLVHLLAISGTHVALLAAALYLLLGALRVPRHLLPWLTIGCVGVYLALIGAPASALRSGIMVAVALLAVRLQRPSASLPIIACAAGVLLALDPLVALDAGFQLSFAGVLGIVAFRAALLRNVPHHWKRGVRKHLVDGAAMSLAAFAATAPITAHHFGTVAPVAVLANLPAIPLTSLALVGVVSAAVLQPLLAPLGGTLAAGTGAMFDLLGWIAALAARVPYGHANVAPPQWSLWAVAALMLLLSLDAAGRLRPRIRWTVAGAVTGAFVLVWPVVAVPRSTGLELHFIDVG